MSQHGVRPALLCGRHPHSRALPSRVVTPQDPPAPPPLCHLHGCHGDQRLPSSCRVSLELSSILPETPFLCLLIEADVVLCVRGSFLHWRGYDPVLAILLFAGALALHSRQLDLKLRLDYLWATQVSAVRRR